MNQSWPAAVFDELYARSQDPWDFRTSRYEAAKYRATLATLGRRRFAAGFEPGCSIGVLTQALTRRCERLLATDCAGAALEQARLTNAGPRHVSFRQARLPGDWPRGKRFDLIVLSEVLYFLSAADLRLTARRASASLRRDGVVLLVNWTGRTTTPQTGHRAAAGFTAASGLQGRSQRQGHYRIDRLARRSPAQTMPQE